MQQEFNRRTNRERTETTKAQLIAAARQLFVEQSYALTGTPEIAAAAGVTRGALYHHFKDKEALLLCVVEQEAASVAEEMEKAAAHAQDTLEALLFGGRAYLGAMGKRGRTNLMLLDAPAVLGRLEADRIDAKHGGRTLREGLIQAMNDGIIAKLPIEALSTILSSAFDRAALSVAQGASEADQILILSALVEGLRVK
jgi:AcrR family transcriptional regulator